jgi:hypothetical protein
MEDEWMVTSIVDDRIDRVGGSRLYNGTSRRLKDEPME